jgi:hypothetical protein
VSILSGAVVFLPANQMVQHKVALTLSWADPLYDSGFYNPSEPTRLTVPAGISFVRTSASIVWGTDQRGRYNARGVRQIVVKKNGAFYPGGFVVNQQSIAPTTTDQGGISAWVPVDEGDYFTIEAWQTSGLAVNAYKASGTWFAIEAM